MYDKNAILIHFIKTLIKTFVEETCETANE